MYLVLDWLCPYIYDISIYNVLCRLNKLYYNMYINNQYVLNNCTYIKELPYKDTFDISELPNKINIIKYNDGCIIYVYRFIGKRLVSYKTYWYSIFKDVVRLRDHIEYNICKIYRMRRNDILSACTLDRHYTPCKVINCDCNYTIKKIHRHTCSLPKIIWTDVNHIFDTQKNLWMIS
jgi:hypothetical protein